MAEPSSAVVVTGSVVVLTMDALLGPQIGLMVRIIAGASIGTAAGGISSEKRGVLLVFGCVFAFFAGLFSSLFQLSGIDVPPALMSAFISFLMVDPKKNISSVMAVIDRIRGTNEVAK